MRIEVSCAIGTVLASDKSTGRILLAHGDPRHAQVLCAHLDNAGFDVHTEGKGQAAYQAAVTETWDALILDVALPEIGGVEMTRTLRSRSGARLVPIILLAENPNRDELLVGLQAGATEYLPRSVDLAELTARLRTLVRLSQGHQQRENLNERLASEVTRQSSRVELLYAYLRELSNARDEDDVYRLMVETIRKATGAMRISVLATDAHTGRLVCKHAVGIDPKVAERVSVDPSSGIAGQVFTTGTTVVAKAVDTARTNGRDYNADAFVSTPLVSTYLTNNEDRLGVLNVTDRPDGEPFGVEDVECICSVADSAAIALYNARRRCQLKKSIRALLLTVGRLSEYRDEETGLHLERVREYAGVLVRQLARHPKFAETITPEFIENLAQAAPLHDVGKVGVPDEILNKPGKLTEEEFQVMKTHTSIGRHTLALAIEETGPIPLLQMCIDIAYCHHERYDGLGYPRGICGDEIPLSARIITLVDAYDAMTSKRCYKEAVPHERAVAIIAKERGRHFDPDVVDTFLEVADRFDIIRSAKEDEIDSPLQLALIAPAIHPA